MAAQRQMRLCSPLLLLPLPLLAGCFNPSYDQGGFACTQGKCPEGFACVSEGASKVCRKGGVGSDSRVDLILTDGRTLDMARHDGRRPDGALSDGKPGDALASDGKPADSLSPDQSCPDADKDTVCDSSDVCPGENDLLDIDGNSTKDCAENKLENGQLATDVSGWKDTSTSPVSWVPEDSEGDGNSGAVRSTNANNTAVNTVTGTEQCVTVSPGKTYHLYAKVFIPTGQAADPTGGFGVFTYESSNCSGSPLTPLSSGSVTAMGAWTLLKHDFTAQSTAVSVRIRLNVTKPASTPTVAIYYDNILMHP